MTATNQFEDEMLDLLFVNEDFELIGDAGGLLKSVTAGSAQISLHTGNAIGDSTTATTASEAAYGNYVRKLVARTTSGWTITTGTVANDVAISYATSSNGPETETDFGITLRATGDVLAIWGSLTNDLVVNNGITPEFAISALAISLD